MKTTNENSTFESNESNIQTIISEEQTNESEKSVKVSEHTPNKETTIIKSINENFIFSKINPLIEESMNNEQKRESKRLIKLALPRQTKKVIEVNICFWFLRLFYITFYLGHEKRDKSRQFDKNFIWEVLVMFISSIFVLSVALSLVFAIFLALYYIKSLIGVDLFDGHLLK